MIEWAQCDICDEYEEYPHVIEDKIVCSKCRKEFDESFEDEKALAFHENREFSMDEFFFRYRLTFILAGGHEKGAD